MSKGLSKRISESRIAPRLRVLCSRAYLHTLEESFQRVRMRVVGIQVQSKSEWSGVGAGVVFESTSPEVAKLLKFAPMADRCVVVLGRATRTATGGFRVLPVHHR